MELRKPLTKTEFELLKEKIIREYKDKHPPQKPQSHIVKRLKKLVTYNIFIGIIFSIVFIVFFGIILYLRTLLTAAIFATIGTAFAGLILKKQ